jgi:hypothetical protein
MKKRTKKYNPKKTNQVIAHSIVKNKVLLMDLAVTDGSVVCFDNIKKKQVPVDTLFQNVINNTCFDWTLVLVVYSTEANGKERTTARFVAAPYPCLHTEITNSLNDVHQDIIAQEKAKKNEVYNAAWAAVPYPMGKLTLEEEEAHIAAMVDLLQTLR